MCRHTVKKDILIFRQTEYLRFTQQRGHFDLATAEDIVQSAFQKLAEQENFPESPDAWFRSVIRNLIRDRCRNQKRCQQWETDTKNQIKTEYEDSYLSEHLDAESLCIALQMLPSDEKEVITAHLWDGLTFSEIAEKFGKSGHCIRQRYEKGIQKLKKLAGK